MLARCLVGFALVWVVPLGVGVAQESDTLVLSLHEAERMALESSPLLAATNVSLESARARRAQASHARFLPRFNLRNVWGVLPRARGVFTETGVLTSPDTSTGLSDLRVFTEVELNLVQPVWTFGRLSGLTEAADFGVDAAEAGVTAQRAEVRLQVRKLYWGLLLASELRGIVEDALAEVTSAQESVQVKLDEGSDDVRQTDLFKLQIFRYEVASRHREVVERIRLAESALRAALGIAADVPIGLGTQSLTRLDVALDSLSAYIELAHRSRPEVDQLQAGISARSSLAGSLAGDFRPQLFLGAQVKMNRAADRFDSRNPFVYNPTNFFRPAVVVGLSWNLNFLQTRDRVRMARFEQEALVARAPLLDAQIRLDVEKAFLAARRAETDISESARALRASGNWLRSEAQTFDLGVGDIKDFIDAFRANGEMRAAHAENIYTFNTALAALSRAIGRDLYPN